LYAVASDVTQLVENQTALNAADNFNISLDSMIIASRENEKINPAMVETLDTEEELLMHPFLDFVHADDKENTQRKLRRFEKALKHLNLKIDGFVRRFY
jgi:hypothetical protein